MLLGEPPRSQGDINFVLFGIPVRVHPFFWLIGLLLGMSLPVKLMLLWLPAFFIGIMVHELGHAFVMRWYGFQPWITLYGLGGMASYNPADAYRLKRDGPMRQIFISAAGPGAGFLLAGVVAAMVFLSGNTVTVVFGRPLGVMLYPVGMEQAVYLHFFVKALFFVTIAYGILNLLPVYPLDGGQISREIWLKINPHNGIYHSLMLSMITGGGLALYSLLPPDQSFFIGIMFGFLAFQSFQAAGLQLATRLVVARFLKMAR